MNKAALLIATTLACALSSAGHANGIAYEFEGVATGGSFNGAPFAGAFDIVATGDTSGVQTAPSPPYSPNTLVNGSIEGVPPTGLIHIAITLAGIGTVDVTDPAYFFNNQTFQVLGFGGSLFGDFFDFSSSAIPALAGYNLTSSIGPFAVTGGGGQFVDTTGGLLLLGSPDAGVFSAQAVPEPAAWSMLLLGIGGLGVAMRTRRGRLAATA
jgi:hypothetical protein